MMQTDRLRFGTYRLQGEKLEKAITTAWNNGIRQFDTARLYRNEAELGHIINKLLSNSNSQDQVYITTKYWHRKDRPMDSIGSEIMYSINSIKMKSPNVHVSVLLHHPCPHYVWQLLEDMYSKGLIDGIGVSNHSKSALKSLLNIARIKPQINQLEINPLIPCEELQPLLQYCSMEDIPVEAHSVLIRRLYTDKSPTTLMQFALSQLGVNKVCIMTTSEEHLLELITSVQRKTERLYPLKPAADPSTAIPTDIDTLSKLIENEIKEGHPSKINHKNTKKIDQVDNTNGTNDTNDTNGTNGTNGTNDTNDTNSIEKVKIQGFSLSGFIPGVKSPYSNMGRDVAKHLYGGLFETEFQAFVKFHALTKKARCEIEVQIKQNDLHNSGKTCCLLKRPKAKRDYLSDPSNTTPISEAVVNPTPMPVTVSPYDHLKPIFDVLQKDSDIIADVEFYKGALRPDAVDLCKQVVGPHIVELCKSLEGTHQMKHFLLGNNIAFEKDQKYANSMADLIKANQPPIETWYLAGNCIGPEAIQIMADAFCQNTVTNALWLKRNPILAQGIPPLVNMFNINRTITLLDLDNCGLLDEGAEALKELKNSAIKHIYLDSNGFTEKGAEYLGEFFKNNINTIKTFYVSVNRIQDAGLIHLLKGASESKVLKRFAVNSNRITDASLEQLAEFTLKMPQLKLLDVGYYKSTFDMGEKPNFFTKPEPFIRIIEQHPNLQHLDLTMNSLSEESALKVLDAAKKRNTLNLYASMLNSTKLSYEALPDKTFQKTLKHPKRVVHIESIYRNKM